MLVVLVSLEAGFFSMFTRYGMAWSGFAAVGLKPPLREHVVATGRMAAVVRRYRGEAGSRPSPAGVADDAVVAPHDGDDQVLVLEANVEAVDLVVSLLR